MFVDAMLLVSDAQAVTATAVSANTIDLGNPTVKNQIGAGEPMAFAVQADVGADFTTTDETYQIDIITSAAANLSSPVVLASYIIPAASLATGRKHALPVGPTKDRMLRYIGLRYTTGGTTPTITVTAYLAPLSMIDVDQPFYPKSYIA